MENNDIYLRAMMSLVARQTFSPERLAEIITPVANIKSYETFNLCDGTKTQSEIANHLKIDAGQLSKQIKRWIDEGVIIRISDGGNTKPVHVYPLPDRFLQTVKKKGTDKNGRGNIKPED